MGTAATAGRTTEGRRSQRGALESTKRCARPLSIPGWVGVDLAQAARARGIATRPPGDEGPLLDPAEAAALAAALEEIPSPAFVIWGDGRVAFANGTGCAASERAPELTSAHLLASLGGRDDVFRVTRIHAPGTPSHFLAVRSRGAADPAPRVVAAATRWGITPRQSEVLALLALGQANKTIARALGCAASTVEIHVTALLARSSCESRSELVSRFWSEPLDPRGREPAGRTQE